MDPVASSDAPTVQLTIATGQGGDIKKDENDVTASEPPSGLMATHSPLKVESSATRKSEFNPELDLIPAAHPLLPKVVHPEQRQPP